MITIDKKAKDYVLYSCDCGVVGKCMFKSFSEEGPCILNVRCAGCGVNITTEVGGHVFCAQEEDIEYSLSIELSNKIIGKDLING